MLSFDALLSTILHIDGYSSKTMTQISTNLDLFKSLDVFELRIKFIESKLFVTGPNHIFKTIASIRSYCYVYSW
jgi:hypothetical protein